MAFDDSRQFASHTDSDNFRYDWLASHFHSRVKQHQIFLDAPEHFPSQNVLLRSDMAPVNR